MMTETYAEGLARSIANAVPTTPETIEAGFTRLAILDGNAAIDFRSAAQRVKERESLSEAEAVRAIWWGYSDR